MSGFYFGYFDWTYLILVLPAFIFALAANSSVKRTFSAYEHVFSRRRITGAEAARNVLDSHGLTGVQIVHVDGKLSDYYDPEKNVVALSSDVYGSTSIASIGVACHEAGHAVQHAENYTPVKIRTAIIPVTNFGSKLAVPLIIIGIILGGFSQEFNYIAYAGIICFALVTLFQLVTLPVEFDASRRAVAEMENRNILDADELTGAKKVLKAAAMTYVAALAVSFAQLLRLIIIFGRRD